MSRYLFLTQTYPRFAGDTAGPFIRDLARALVRGGDAVTVVVPHAAGVEAGWDDDGVRVVSFADWLRIDAAEIAQGLPEAEGKIWHRHPVWFLDGNPIVGYSKLKDCVRLMFWSGDDFGEPKLKPGTGKFKDASIRYTNVAQIDTDDLRRWLKKSETIQWDYKNVVRRKGRLERIGDA